MPNEPLKNKADLDPAMQGAGWKRSVQTALVKIQFPQVVYK